MSQEIFLRFFHKMQSGNRKRLNRLFKSDNTQNFMKQLRSIYQQIPDIITLENKTLKLFHTNSVN